MNHRLFLAVLAFSLTALTITSFAHLQETTFNLTPEKKVLNCLSGNDGYSPAAQVTIQRGNLNDTLILHAQHLKPNTGFDVFTVQNSNLLSDGTANPKFKNFGLAWYQSDLQTDSQGRAEVTIKTILLDQIFGFDPVVGLPPTNTFHHWILVQQSGRRGCVRFRPDEAHSVQRRTQRSRSSGDDFPARPHDRSRTALHQPGTGRNGIRVQALTDVASLAKGSVESPALRQFSERSDCGLRCTP